MKKGKEYELLIKEIYAQLAENATVIHDDKIYDKSSKSLRQIDVSIRHKMAEIEYLTIIEVKDYTHKAGIGIVEGFARVIEDVSANKGIIICAKGFSKHAIEKAKTLGIELLTFHSAKNKNWETVIKSVVHRKTFYFKVDYHFSSDLIPVKQGQLLAMENFLSYNKKDLLTIHDVIKKEIIGKNKLRDLSRRETVINFKDLSLYSIFNEEFFKIKEGFLSARLLRVKEEVFYIEPIDYLIKSNHVIGEKKVQELVWDIDTLLNLLTDNVESDKSIVVAPNIEMIAYVFSDNSSSGKFNFNTDGGIKGDIILKGNHIMKTTPNLLRAMELENKFRQNT